jgi:unsaturated rhamnogalacturonyl hydrolase
MSRAARWELAALGDTAPNDWVHAAFYAGVMEAFRATGDAFYVEAARRWAAGHGYRLYQGRGPRFADDQACTQTYLDLYLAGPRDERLLAAARTAFDGMLAEPLPGRVDWWWCDALFMAPPALARLARATGDGRYDTMVDRLFWDTTAYLFSEERGLFYRDGNYLGGDVFWARGNGWVMSAIGRLLDQLETPRRGDYLALLARLADAIVPLQGDDGAWRADLLHPAAFPAPEMSGTGLIVHGLAWGIAQGVLDRARYLPAVTRGWEALAGATSDDGRLGWIQPRGHEPRPTRAEDHSPFGTGALLLAGAAISAL